jgi:hypothetical protein
MQPDNGDDEPSEISESEVDEVGTLYEADIRRARMERGFTCSRSSDARIADALLNAEFPDPPWNVNRRKHPGHTANGGTCDDI